MIAKKKFQGEIVVLQNDVINWGHLDLEATELKILFYIIAHLNRFDITKEITKEDYDKLKLEPVKLILSNVVKDLNLETHYTIIKKTLHKMSQIYLTIKKPDFKTIGIPLLSEFKYNPNNEGLIEIEFNQKMKRYLLPLSMFTELNLIPLLNFKSKYFPSFYSYLKMHKQFNKNKVTISLKTLGIILNLKESYKKDFYEFRKRVLNKVIEDFNKEYCDIWIEKVETIRQGKKITSIDFYIKRNKQVLKDIKELKSPIANRLIIYS